MSAQNFFFYGKQYCLFYLLVYCINDVAMYSYVNYITRTLVTICQSSCYTPFVQILTVRMH